MSERRLKLVVHDYSGHPFQIQLSRNLAARGHRVSHLYCSSNPTTPKGSLAPRKEDPPTLSIASIPLPRPIVKGAFVRRWLLERLYGRRLARRLRAIAPDVVLLANTPLDAAAIAGDGCMRNDIDLVYWLQDLIGEASVRILTDKLGFAGQLIGRHYQTMEKRLLAKCSQIVGITEDFGPIVAGMGIGADRYTTIPNWAPLGEVVPRPKDNPWARRQGLEEAFVFLYSGTLGFKHNPGLLLSLARAFQDDPDVRVVVNSQGDAADWLRYQAERRGLASLRVNPFQAYEAMSDVLGTADVLVSILEPEAGIYSVPSKVLSYHSAGRPLLLAVPGANLASRIVREAQTGLGADPLDERAFVAAARRLYDDPVTRAEMGERARAYAERNFDIERIADRFEAIIQAASADQAGPVE